MSNAQDDALPGPTVLSIMGHIDLDENGEADFFFSERRPVTGGGNTASGNWGLVLFGQTRSGEVVNSTSEYESPYMPILDAGERIGVADSALTWSSGASLAEGDVFANEWKGPFVGDTPQYVGVRLLREDGKHYGWIQLNIDTTGAGRYPLGEDSTYYAAKRPKLRVYDYAVHEEAQAPIRAGEKP